MGLLSQQQQPEQAPGSDMVNLDQARNDMDGTMDKLKRLVLAGQTALYSEQSSEKFMQFLTKDDIPKSVGQIAAMVMAILIDKGREQAAPPNLIIPAGALIAADLLDYACKLYDVEMTEELQQATLTAFAETMQQGVEQGQAQQPQQAPAAGPAQAQVAQPMQGAM